MKTMQNNKSPASNGLFKGFYESFEMQLIALVTEKKRRKVN